MPLIVRDFYQFLENLAPLRLAEPKDSNGLQIGSFDAPVQGILLAINPTLQAFKTAKALGCNLLLTHHPLFYQPLTSLIKEEYPGKVIYFAIENQLNLLSWHTPLDKVSFGVSEALAQTLGLETEGFILSEEGAGLGKVAKLKKCVKLEALAKQIKKAIKSWVMLVGDPEKEVQKIALCGGSGSFLKDHLKRLGLDTLITSDVKYHQALASLEEGFNFILIDHGVGESFVLRVLKDKLQNYLKERGAALPIHLWQEESPYKIY